MFRYIHICWPLRSRRLNTLRLSRMMTSFTVVAAVGCTVAAQYDAAFQLLSPHTTDLPGALEKMALLMALYSVAAFFLVLMLNVVVIIQMVRTSRSAIRENNQHTSNRGTIMILSMTGIFLLLKLPYVIGIVLWIADPPGGRLWVSVGITMNTANSSVNLFVYLATSANFRTEFAAVCSSCCSFGRRCQTPTDKSQNSSLK